MIKNCIFCEKEFIDEIEKFCCYQCKEAFVNKMPKRESVKSPGTPFNVKRNFYSKILDDFREYRKHHTIMEAASYFGIGISAAHNISIEYDCLNNITQKRKLCPNKLTALQMEYMNGNMLGDGSVPWIKPSKNNRFVLVQNTIRREYIDDLFDVYCPFSSKIWDDQKKRKPSRINGGINHDIENWGGEYTYSITLSTVAHPVFTKLRQMWYKNPEIKRSPKSIPNNLILTWKTAAIWTCDDGSNSCKPSKGCKHGHRNMILHTQSFSSEDIEYLLYRLKLDLEIDASMNKSNSIYIGGDNWERFTNGIRPFIPWDCLAYKYYNRPKLPTYKLSPTGEMYISSHNNNKFRVRVKNLHIGIFDTIEKAIEARDRALH